MENAFGILASRFKVLLGIIEQGQSLLETLFLHVVLHNMLRTHRGRIDRATTPADDIAPLQNEQVVYVPNDIHRNPSK